MVFHLPSISWYSLASSDLNMDWFLFVMLLEQQGLTYLEALSHVIDSNCLIKLTWGGYNNPLRLCFLLGLTPDPLVAAHALTI
jgi:hypothetical protein